jgi:hypothetical protein
MAGPQNKLADLNNHLFAQLERLGDEDMSEEETKKEIERARAITGVAKQIISNGNLVLKAAKFADEKLDNDSDVPRMLLGD